MGAPERVDGLLLVGELDFPHPLTVEHNLLDGDHGSAQVLGQRGRVKQSIDFAA